MQLLKSIKLKNKNYQIFIHKTKRNFELTDMVYCAVVTKLLRLFEFYQML